MASSPEVKKKQALRKIEADLKAVTPPLYHSGVVQPAFAEALRQLFVSTRPIGTILADTLCSDDAGRSHQFTEQLLLTGFPPEIQETMESFEYENRKNRARDMGSHTRFVEHEHRQLEHVVKYLNTPEFVKMDTVLARLWQLNDVCKYSYTTALRLFDPAFSAAETYTPQFQGIAVDLLEGSLQDLYYVIATMDISLSLSNAVVALYCLYHRNATQEERDGVVESLKKVQGLLRHVISAENVQGLLRLAKKEPTFVPTRASYPENARKNYAAYLEDRFQVDCARLKGELQDETISNELSQIFGATPLATVSGYNNELNAQLKQSTPAAFTFVLPLQILKTFINAFYEGHAKPLLNDIAIEGFFNNSTFKTEFSSDVYALNECLDRIGKFEANFARNGAFSEAEIVSLIHDGHKDTSLMNRLRDLVERANRTAKELVQSEVNIIFRVYKSIGEILVESKKASSDIITNLRVLMLSSRNRDNSELLEKQYGSWTLFLEIMKNYVIITNIEKKQ